MSNTSAQQAKHLVNTNYMGVRDRIEKFQKPRVRPDNKGKKQWINNR